MLRLVEPDETPIDEQEAMLEALVAVQRIERSPLLSEPAQAAARAFRGVLERHAGKVSA